MAPNRPKIDKFDFAGFYVFSSHQKVDNCPIERAESRQAQTKEIYLRENGFIDEQKSMEKTEKERSCLS